MKNNLFLRLKYGFGTDRTDYKLYKFDGEGILYKGIYKIKQGSINDLKNYLRKKYKSHYKKIQKRIAYLIGKPYVSKYAIPTLERYL